jgi:large subunit ribosomal protein L15
MNGQMSRSGAKRRAWFEGGQMPLQRRVPKRGFNNHFRKQYQVINISSINKITESEITPEVLFKYKLIDSEKKLVKILSPGELETAKKVTVDACSKAAMEKIKKAGGEIIIRNYPTKIQDKEQGK